MRIGLIGAPGTGKTALAETLKTALEEPLDANVYVVDGYAEAIEKRQDLAVGWMGGYLANLNIALEREARERIALDHFTHVITCGTVIDSATYVALDGADLLNGDDEVERLDDLRRIEATMRVLSCLYIDTFKYDHVFYLPSGPTSLYSRREFDKNLQVAFQAFNLTKVTPLLEGGKDVVDLTANRCKTVLETITKEGD
jgi:hypothetical protein